MLLLWLKVMVDDVAATAQLRYWLHGTVTVSTDGRLEQMGAVMNRASVMLRAVCRLQCRVGVNEVVMRLGGSDQQILATAVYQMGGSCCGQGRGWQRVLVGDVRQRLWMVLVMGLSRWLLLQNKIIYATHILDLRLRQSFL